MWPAGGRHSTSAHVVEETTTKIMRAILLIILSLSAASAARPPGGGTAVLVPLAPINHDEEATTKNTGVAELGSSENKKHQEEPQPQPRGTSSGSRLTAPLRIDTLTSPCAKAYDILNSDAGYRAAVDVVFQDARIVGKEAGEKCAAAMQPSLSPLGGKCSVAAQPFWTAERQADIDAVTKACAVALPPSEVASIVWFDEEVITQPFPWAPFVGVALRLTRILPVYVPASCVDDADMSEVLSYFNNACMKEEPQFKSCTFSVSDE